MASEPLQVCPKCPVELQRPVKRLIGKGGAVLFRGSGFYETDYKKKTGGENVV